MGSQEPGARLGRDSEGNISVSPFTLPMSAALSEQARGLLAASLAREGGMADIPSPGSCASEEDYRQKVDAFRVQLDTMVAGPMTQHLLARYPVRMTDGEIGRVKVEEFEPESGARPGRVLINLHGGAFCCGAGTISRVESIPVASMGGYRVVSVDYRQAWEHRFPAASEDVASVYEELLKDYPAGNIGIYGASAGGTLAAQAAAWIIDKGLPVPGAIGVFAAGTAGAGDSDWFSQIGTGKHPPFGGWRSLNRREFGYFKGTSPDDPLVDPIRAPLEFRAKFPPTLFITGTRAFDLSPAIATHRALVQAGVEADLHVFDGLGHAFFYDAMTPESLDAYATILRFFDKHLGG